MWAQLRRVWRWPLFPGWEKLQHDSKQSAPGWDHLCHNPGMHVHMLLLLVNEILADKTSVIFPIWWLENALIILKTSCSKKEKFTKSSYSTENDKWGHSGEFQCPQLTSTSKSVNYGRKQSTTKVQPFRLLALPIRWSPSWPPQPPIFHTRLRLRATEVVVTRDVITLPATDWSESFPYDSAIRHKHTWHL